MLRAKLFRNGASQAVRLPKECRFEGREVFVKPLGRALLLLPIDGGWDAMRESLELFTDDFMAERGQPPTQDRDVLD